MWSSPLASLPNVPISGTGEDPPSRRLLARDCPFTPSAEASPGGRATGTADATALARSLAARGVSLLPPDPTWPPPLAHPDGHAMTST